MAMTLVYFEVHIHMGAHRVLRLLVCVMCHVLAHLYISIRVLRFLDCVMCWRTCTF